MMGVAAGEVSPDSGCAAKRPGAGPRSSWKRTPPRPRIFTQACSMSSPSFATEGWSMVRSGVIWPMPGPSCVSNAFDSLYHASLLDIVTELRDGGVVDGEVRCHLADAGTQLRQQRLRFAVPRKGANGVIELHVMRDELGVRVQLVLPLLQRRRLGVNAVGAASPPQRRGQGARAPS